MTHLLGRPPADELFTANDNPRRDPTAWDLHLRGRNETWVLLSRVRDVRAPRGRRMGYGGFKVPDLAALSTGKVEPGTATAASVRPAQTKTSGTPAGVDALVAWDPEGLGPSVPTAVVVNSARQSATAPAARGLWDSPATSSVSREGRPPLRAAGTQRVASLSRDTLAALAAPTNMDAAAQKAKHSVSVAAVTNSTISTISTNSTISTDSTISTISTNFSRAWSGTVRRSPSELLVVVRGVLGLTTRAVPSIKRHAITAASKKGWEVHCVADIAIPADHERGLPMDAVIKLMKDVLPARPVRATKLPRDLLRQAATTHRLALRAIQFAIGAADDIKVRAACEVLGFSLCAGFEVLAFSLRAQCVSLCSRFPNMAALLVLKVS